MPDSETPACRNCPWWAPLAPPRGQCRRYPPVIAWHRTTSHLGAHVETVADHWCGEHPALAAVARRDSD